MRQCERDLIYYDVSKVNTFKYIISLLVLQNRLNVIRHVKLYHLLLFFLFLFYGFFFNAIF